MICSNEWEKEGKTMQDKERNIEKILGTAGFYKGVLAIAIPIMLQQLIQSIWSLQALHKRSFVSGNGPTY